MVLPSTSILCMQVAKALTGLCRCEVSSELWLLPKKLMLLISTKTFWLNPYFVVIFSKWTYYTVISYLFVVVKTIAPRCRGRPGAPLHSAYYCPSGRGRPDALLHEAVHGTEG